MYFSSVPSWRKTTSAITGKYALSMSTTCRGLRREDMAVKPVMSEKRMVTFASRTSSGTPRSAFSWRTTSGGKKRW